MEKGAKAAEEILRCYPQADQRATDEFAGQLTKLLATLTEEELGWVMDLRRGVMARCKFLPTPADIMEVVREGHAKADQFSPSGDSGYKRFEPSRDDYERWKPEERDPAYRKSVVRQHLGEDWGRAAEKRPLTPPSAADIDALGGKLKLKLAEKSDLTPQMRALLDRQDVEDGDTRWF